MRLASTLSRRQRCRQGVASLALALAACLSAASAMAETAIPAWKVIVHPSNTQRSMTPAELERIYRRRTKFWLGGGAIVPLNLPGEDPLRRAFTLEVLHLDEDELATYWNREYFQGVPPPVVLQSSQSVRAYVAATPNAIGYVRSEDIDATVAVVEVTRGN